MANNIEDVPDIDMLFYKKNFFVNTISQICTNQSNLPESLKKKVAKIQADVELSMYMTKDERSDIDHRSSNIFGLAPLEIDKLSYSDQKTLQAELEKYIIANYPKTLKKYDSITDGLIEKLLTKPTTLKDGLTEEQVVLMELFNMYHKKMKESLMMNVDFFNLMTEWVEMRLGPVVTNAEKSVKILDSKNKLLELKSKLVNNQLSHTVYSQNSSTVNAYMKIHEDITKSIEKLKGEISVYKNIIEKSDGHDITRLD